ncbi:40S ribosomal protein S10 [Chionoecetes opilio]|uniref:40S ribosomal protein S10 n=1 Tax=Chionoecetes opilio TaxID=41210 RepID=A0A8J4XZV6_CHIOP|nr:40S ribosomal protein S10 [Chionoecetes opilio]
MVAERDLFMPKHPELEKVPNLHVIKALQSLKSRGYVEQNFAWRHYYWRLTNEGIQYLRDYLHLPAEIVPATLKKPTRPEGRPRPMQSRPEGPRGEGSRDAYRRGPSGMDKTGDAGAGSSTMEFCAECQWTLVGCSARRPSLTGLPAGVELVWGCELTQSLKPGRQLLGALGGSGEPTVKTTSLPEALVFAGVWQWLALHRTAAAPGKGTLECSSPICHVGLLYAMARNVPVDGRHHPFKTVNTLAMLPDSSLASMSLTAFYKSLLDALEPPLCPLANLQITPEARAGSCLGALGGSGEPTVKTTSLPEALVFAGVWQWLALHRTAAAPGKGTLECSSPICHVGLLYAMARNVPVDGRHHPFKTVNTLAMLPDSSLASMSLTAFYKSLLDALEPPLCPLANLQITCLPGCGQWLALHRTAAAPGKGILECSSPIVMSGVAEYCC